MASSNQVYRNLQDNKPYNGEVFATQYQAVSDGAGAVQGFVGIELSRVDPGHAMLAITGSEAAAWGAGTLSLVIANGSIPVQFRPRVDQLTYCTFHRAPTTSIPCRILISALGGIQFIAPDFTTATRGNPLPIPAGDQVYPTTFVYPIN